MNLFNFIFLLFCTIQIAISELDKSIFKTCKDSSFCLRCRAVTSGNSQFAFDPESFKVYPGYVTAEILNKEIDHVFTFKLAAVKDNKFQILINEKDPLKPRYRTEHVIIEPLELDYIRIETKLPTAILIASGENQVRIQYSPLKIDFLQNNVVTLSLNAKGLMKFEQLRNPNNGESFQESFLTFVDTRPRGPEAVAMDFTFPKADVLFGIPEHGDSLALKTTIGDEPYRLYNLDVAFHELDSRMSLYGAVPVLYGHGPEKSVGVFWLNPSETWVDIDNTVGSPSAHFMSESGVLEMFILMGPLSLDTFKQYTDLTGTRPLPQLYTLAYHQSRWNYMDDKDIATVHSKFDEFNLPLDTLWLDIEYTDAKKYFTWDSTHFPNPLEMIQNLTDKNRHLVIIIDPHIKVDENYFFHKECSLKGYYVKDKDGKDFQGECWPGVSSYCEFFNPVVRKYYGDQYLLENFKTTTNDINIWNDMNEPSVFDGPEKTMDKDIIHYGGWEHRDVHNLYGHMQVMSTYDGLMRRSGDKKRPFILTRSHFAGSQRYAAIWTGDNTGEWPYLAASIQMCLASAVAGFSFCGADIGGFFYDPEVELVERWYQTGAFLPFMRAHSNMDTIRREPYLYQASTVSIIRDAINKRYNYLPFWYTKFYEHEKFGYPVMRPLFTQYPKDKTVFKTDTSFLLADELFVNPVMEKGVTKVDVYFPFKETEGSGDIWYDIDTYTSYKTVGIQSIDVNSSKIPVFQRGGTIIPKKKTIRQSSKDMKNDPYTLIVCLDENQKASGTLFIDDEESFEYQNGHFMYLSFEFKNGNLSGSRIDGLGYSTQSILNRIVFAGLDADPFTITTNSDKSKLTIVDGIPIVSDLNLKMTEDWFVSLDFTSSGIKYGSKLFILSSILIGLYNLF